MTTKRKPLFNEAGERLGTIELSAITPNRDGREQGNAFPMTFARQWHQDMIDRSGNHFLMVWLFTKKQATWPIEDMPWTDSHINRVVLQQPTL